MSSPQNARAGNYAVTTGKARPWLSTPIAPVQPKARRSKNAPIIKNPIFEECSRIVSDPFWVSLFHQAALGKFPRGFLYNDGHLTYKRGTRVTRVEIPTIPMEAMSAAMSFLMKTAGIMSEQDQKRAKEAYDAHASNVLSIHNCTWSQIKRDKVKEILTHAFVQDVAEFLSLTEREKQQLASTIHIGFFLGYFQPKHVMFEHGKVRSISGLNFDTQTRKFSIDSTLTPKINKSKTAPKKNPEDKSNEKKSFMTHWVKFLDKFQKKCEIPTSPIVIMNSPSLIVVDDPDRNDEQTPST